jgi:hypothetical protein
MMKPRPIYRWKSFWLGILVLGFLGSAWAFSMGRSSGVSFMQGKRETSLHQVDGAVGISSGVYFGKKLKAEWDGWHAGDVISEIPRFPSAVWRHTESFGSYSAVRYFAAHWFLMLLFLVPWSAFLAWRWNKQKKAHEAAPAH